MPAIVSWRSSPSAGAAERRAARRRRNAVLGIVGALAAGAMVVVGFNVLAGDDPRASSSPSPSASPSPDAGVQTGTVEPGTAPDEVACGG